MVATAAQIAANRANALRSTGPRTPEGKAASSRNALTHGAHASDDTILATSADTYLADFRAHFQPADALEAHLVAHLAVLASRRDRLQVAMDALLELNERHALIEHLHERYGLNNPNAFIDGQPSWQAALRRYDGNTYVDDRFPEPASDPALDPDPILCSLAYTLSGPRAAALFRHEASVDRRFTATLKELTALQTQRRAAAATEDASPSAGQLYEPTLQRALDRYLRDISPAQTSPLSDAAAPAVPAPSTHSTFAPVRSSPAVLPGACTPADESPRAQDAHLDVSGVTTFIHIPEGAPVHDADNQRLGSSMLLSGLAARGLHPEVTPPSPGSQVLQPDQSQSGSEDRDSATRPAQIKPGVVATAPNDRVSVNASPLHTQYEAAATHNPAENEPSTFLSVLPRHPNQPSTIPCDHWSSHG
jgi:hypothetical protein